MINAKIKENGYEIYCRYNFSTSNIHSLDKWEFFKSCSSLIEVEREIKNKLDAGYKPVNKVEGSTLVITFESPSLNPDKKPKYYCHLRIRPLLKINIDGLEKRVE